MDTKPFHDTYFTKYFGLHTFVVDENSWYLDDRVFTRTFVLMHDFKQIACVVVKLDTDSPIFRLGFPELDRSLLTNGFVADFLRISREGYYPQCQLRCEKSTVSLYYKGRFIPDLPSDAIKRLLPPTQALSVQVSQ